MKIEVTSPDPTSVAIIDCSPHQALIAKRQLSEGLLRL